MSRKTPWKKRCETRPPPFPFLYGLCVGDNYSYIPTKDFEFATTALTSPHCNVDGNRQKQNISSFFPADVYLRHTYISHHQHPQILTISFDSFSFLNQKLGTRKFYIILQLRKPPSPRQILFSQK